MCRIITVRNAVAMYLWEKIETTDLWVHVISIMYYGAVFSNTHHFGLRQDIGRQVSHSLTRGSIFSAPLALL